MEFFRTFGRITRLHFHSGFVLWRWALITAIFALAGGLCVDILRHHFNELRISRQVDVWDIFPALSSHNYIEHFLLAFGFLLFVGDRHHRQCNQGTALLFAIRAPSRSLYWLGTMGALGLDALFFMSICFVTTFVIGCIAAPPESLWPMLPRETIAPLRVSVEMPLPLYSLLLMVYTAWGLWIGGSIVVLVSTFFRNTAILLGVIAGWVVLSLIGSGNVRFAFERFLFIGELIGHHKHDGKPAMSLGTFFLGSTLMLVLIAFIGSWRMGREEI
jgi:hypothetical protein